MSALSPFPHAQFTLTDNSVPELPVDNSRPLHIPHFLGFAEQGPPNTPVFADAKGIRKIFGEQTFTARSPYYLHPNMFAAGAMALQKIMFTRLVPEDAAAASLVLEAQVSDVQLTQYETDASGVRITDANGDWVAKLDGGGAVITEPGIQITFATRALKSTETYDSVQIAVSGGVTTYPIICTKGDVGARGNRVGFKLYWNPRFETSVVEATEAMLYRFVPVELQVTTNIASVVRNRYQSAYSDVVLMADALDATTERYVSLSDVMARDYDADTFPYSLHVYSDFVGAIGERILAVSPELVDDGIGPYRVNILSARNELNRPYDHCVVTNAATTVGDKTVLYQRGGSDGTMVPAPEDDTTDPDYLPPLDRLTIEMLAGRTNPAIRDSARYPFTHVYDSGYRLKTKEAILPLYDLRDDVKIEFCTQDSMLEPNSEAEDISTGIALRAKALLYPESAIEGTPLVRASFYTQCAKRASSTAYRPIVPLIYDRMIKRCRYDSRPYITGVPKGLPASALEGFDVSTINWSPATDEEKQALWQECLNYAQYYDQDAMHYADLRSAYPIDRSVLSSDTFVDRIIYTKHIVRGIWAEFSGREDPPAELYSAIEKRIDAEIAYAFKNTIPAKATVFQTALEKALGYQTSVQIAMPGNVANRVWNVNIVVSRQEA